MSMTPVNNWENWQKIRMNMEDLINIINQVYQINIFRTFNPTVAEQTQSSHVHGTFIYLKTTFQWILKYSSHTE